MPVTITLSLKVTVKLARPPALISPFVSVIPVTVGANDTTKFTAFSEALPAVSVAMIVML